MASKVTKSKSWVKLWCDILDDPKVGHLSLAHRALYMLLLALAGKLNHVDAENHDTGKLDTLEYIAWHLRLDLEEVREGVAVMTKCGLLHETDGILFVSNFRKRQSDTIPNSDKPENRAKRQRKSRARRKAEEPVTDGHEPVTECHDTEKEKDQEQDTEQEKETASASDAPGTAVAGAVAFRSLFDFQYSPFEACDACMPWVRAHVHQVLEVGESTTLRLCLLRGPYKAMLCAAYIEALRDQNPGDVRKPGGLWRTTMEDEDYPSLSSIPANSWFWQRIYDGCEKDCHSTEGLAA